MSDDAFELIKHKLRDFAAERDWDQFHSPKNLAMALNVEAAELLEHFQWLTESQSASLNAETLSEVAEEIADIQLYLMRLADKLGVDIVAASLAKIEKNAEKYPADKVRGSSKKYTKYVD
jgi:NTP pyrophosphatase (non-canonical NTP hydrolase)